MLYEITTYKSLCFFFKKALRTESAHSCKSTLMLSRVGECFANNVWRYPGNPTKLVRNLSYSFFPLLLQQFLIKEVQVIVEPSGPKFHHDLHFYHEEIALPSMNFEHLTSQFSKDIWGVNCKHIAIT